MKRVFLFLMILLVVSSLVFAGGQRSSSNTVTILLDRDGDRRGLEAVIRAIEQNLGIRTEVEVRPGGTEGDNIVRTRLATNTMSDIFMYNSGSLFHALNPGQYILDITNEPFMARVTDEFKNSVTSNGRIYGFPGGYSMGGGILYNRAIYRELGLSVPRTWAEFMANNERIRASGRTAIIASLRDTWTSQLFLLGDNYNVLRAMPNWPVEYTAGRAKYATTPIALRGFQKTADIGPFLSADALATTFDQAAAMLANGQGAHWAMLTFVLANIQNDFPNRVDDIGFFAIPGDNAANYGLTVWAPTALYINKNSSNVENAKRWLAFYGSVEGQRIFAEAQTPDGPPCFKGATLPPDVVRGVRDMQVYFDGGRTGLALEYESPVKGPNLEQILVEVMTGRMTPLAAAQAYDEDVRRQAIQLGLPGW